MVDSYQKGYIKMIHPFQQPKSSQKKLRGRMYEMRKKEKGSVNQHTVAKVQNEPLQTTAEVIAKETTDAAAGGVD